MPFPSPKRHMRAAAPSSPAATSASYPRRYSPEEMMRALSALTTDALLLPDSLHVPLYARGTSKDVRCVIADAPQQPVLVSQ